MVKNTTASDKHDFKHSSCQENNNPKNPVPIPVCATLKQDFCAPPILSPKTLGRLVARIRQNFNAERNFSRAPEVDRVSSCFHVARGWFPLNDVTPRVVDDDRKQGSPPPDDLTEHGKPASKRIAGVTVRVHSRITCPKCGWLRSHTRKRPAHGDHQRAPEGPKNAICSFAILH